MAWGLSKWGSNKWGEAGLRPISSKFTGMACKSMSLTYKFSAHAAYSPAAIQSKFKAYAGQETSVLVSKFWGYAARIVVGHFAGAAVAYRQTNSRFFGRAGATRNIISKFGGRAGQVKTVLGKFGGCAVCFPAISSRFKARAGSLRSVASKFHANAACVRFADSKFHGLASIDRTIVASKFDGNCGYVPLMYSKFSGVAFKARHYELNGVDITNNIMSCDFAGFGTKTSIQQVPGSDDVDIEDIGSEAGTVKLDLRFRSDAEMQAFLEACNNLSHDVKFYAGRDDRYLIASHVAVQPYENMFLRRRFRQKVTLYCERKYLLNELADTFGGLSYVLPVKSHEMKNIGSYKSQFTFSVQGYYEGGHTESLSATLYNGEAAERTFPISDRLLSDELLILDETGMITGSYSDAFETSEKYLIDAVASNCVWSPGKLRIDSTGYLIYRLAGPLLLEKNIKLIADLTRVSGEPYILVSTDGGATYNTSIPYASLKDGLWTYWLTGSAKYSNVYIKIYCPSGAVLDINSIGFETKRNLRHTAYYDQLPEVEPGESRALQISGTGGSGRATVTIWLRSRWRL